MSKLPRLKSLVTVQNRDIKCLHKLILQQTGIVGVNNEQANLPPPVWAQAEFDIAKSPQTPSTYYRFALDSLEPLR